MKCTHELEEKNIVREKMSEKDWKLEEKRGQIFLESWKWEKS